MPSQQIYLIRHGETEWSLNGRHTGASDIPLTEKGRQVARRWQPFAAERTFALVLTSPLGRARETCVLAGLGERAEIDPDLREWDYGAYEGLTPQQIRAQQPGWMIFRDGCPSGESPQQVGTRVDRVIARMRGATGDVAAFAHGHVLRVLGARWLGLPPSAGSHFLLDTATVCVLSAYHGVPAIRRWNAPLVSRGAPRPS
ncbi:MAG TPA: histidine phosphatase family protein [Steroidobacteraceae bacterium]|nr:histidine phosphatase family protein [Steroidobacteraceae bacterium]